MLLQIKDLHKSIGNKTLYSNLDLILNESEKTALIGRNGTGKTTLLNIIASNDTDFEGSVEKSSGLSIVLTQQEHFLGEDLQPDTTPLDYILDSVPQYSLLQRVIRKHENSKNYDQEYLEAIDTYTELGYYTVEDEILSTLASFQIDEDKALSSILSLSGGEKRFVELTRVMFSNAQLALIDEPTNHMDTVGKQKFLEWMNQFNKTLLIITHDRDVLHHVNKIYELKDQNISTYRGNYEHYLRQNAIETITLVHSYETDSKRIDKIKKQMNDAKEKKLSAKSDKGRDRAKQLEERFKREYQKLKETLKKPSFWIDAETEKNLPDQLKDLYKEYKSQNIQLKQDSSTKQVQRLLLQINKVTLGYDCPLFSPIDFDVFEGDRINLQGRNGIGKTTFLKYLIKKIEAEDLNGNIKNYSGSIEVKRSIKLGVYKQEVDTTDLDLSLWDGIEKILKENEMPVNDQKVIQLLRMYLFNVELHSKTNIRELSGGEKARFQLMKMLMKKPDILILDEPTNHLDLPSIEELENFLDDFAGAIIYVSHDSYFAKNMGGNVVSLSPHKSERICL
ncbi:ATP-binding cassette domain-containing protein [Candidatus Dojkabacteria bacterium]|nr:ATP-binding cassette domain-containing protein [Candidatus Dojkabacteria bacterium]